MNYDIISILEKIKFSTEDKLNLFHNIKEILQLNLSKEETSSLLVQKIEDLFSSKLEEIKEHEELKQEGQLINGSKKSYFKRIV